MTVELHDESRGAAVGSASCSIASRRFRLDLSLVSEDELPFRVIPFCVCVGGSGLGDFAAEFDAETGGSGNPWSFGSFSTLLAFQRSMVSSSSLNKVLTLPTTRPYSSNTAPCASAFSRTQSIMSPSYNSPIGSPSSSKIRPRLFTFSPSRILRGGLYSFLRDVVRAGVLFNVEGVEDRV